MLSENERTPRSQGTAFVVHAENCDRRHLPALWKPGTYSRSTTNVHSAPYTVLDFDGFDGIKPSTPAELQQHLHASLAIIHWLRDRQRWQLAAILHTGGKSLHAWFHTPPPEILAPLKTTAPALGIDPTLMGNPEHPCRLPGMIHQGTGEKSRVVWLSWRLHS